MADEATVGSIIGYLRMDNSDFIAKVEEAKRAVEDLQRNNPDIRIGVNSATAQAELARLQTQLDALRNENVDIRVNLGSAQAEIDQLRERLRTSGGRGGQDFSGAFDKAVQKGIRATLASIPKVEINADTTPAEAKLQEIRANLDELSQKKIGVDISGTQAELKLANIKRELDELNRSSVDNIRLRVDTAEASAALAKLNAELHATKAAANGGASSSSGGGAPGVLGVAIAAAVTLIGPLTAAATAGAAAIAADVGVAALAYKGLQTEIKQGTVYGVAMQSQFHSIGSELTGLEHTAAQALGPGVLGALGAVKAFLPTLNPLVHEVGTDLGHALNIGAGGTITALKAMQPLLADGGKYAEMLAQKFADFAASPEFAHFVAYAQKELPVVGKDIGDLVVAGKDLAVALQPVGDELLKIIDLGAKAVSLISKVLTPPDAYNDHGHPNTAKRILTDILDPSFVNPASPKVMTPDNNPATAGASSANAHEAMLAAQSLQAEHSAVQALAGSFQLSIPAYEAATAAQQKTRQASWDAAAQFRLESDAGGLLKMTLDGLSGKSLSYAQAQNQFEQGLVNMAKHTTAADAAVTGLSSSAIKNRGDLLTLVSSAESAAEAFGSMDKSGLKTHDRLVSLRQQIINNAVANGENRAAVTAYIDSVLKIPPAVTTKVDLQEAAAAAKLAQFKAFVGTLPRSIQMAVTLGGASTAEYELQLLARNRTAVITTVVGGQSAVGVHSVGGVQANASGGTVPEGLSTINEQGWEVLEKHGNQVIVHSHADSKKLLPQGPSVPAFADGSTGSGIVTLTPTKASRAKAVAKATKAAKSSAVKSTAAKAGTIDLTITAHGGEVYGIASYLKGQIPSAAHAAGLLSAAVDDAFKLKGIQARISAVKADLANLRQAQASLSSSAASSLSANTDPSQYGSISDYTAYLRARTAQNSNYIAELHKVGGKIPTDLLAQYASSGPSAGLDALAGASPAQLAALSKASTQFGASVRGGAAAAGGIYAPGIAKDNQNLAKATTQLAAVSNATARLALALGEYTKHPVSIVLDGKTVATTKFVNNQIQGAINELEHTLITGRR